MDLIKIKYLTGSVGLQLVIRIIVLGLSAFNKDVNFLSASIIFGVLFCVHGVVNPFKSKFYNIQEALILLDLLAIHITAFYNSKDGRKNVKAINYLILIAAIYFAIIFIYQCLFMVVNKRNSNMILNFKKLFTYKELNLLKRESSKNKESNITIELTTTIPNMAYNYKDFQEPLLALSD